MVETGMAGFMRSVVCVDVRSATHGGDNALGVRALRIATITQPWGGIE